ncbi:hypothetical protein AB205_0149200, partial [Aquarana catesbeiana]
EEEEQRETGAGNDDTEEEEDGITVPSAFSAVYYLVFIGFCTWWACHLPISHIGLNTLSVMVGFFAGGHLICLYGYQTPFIQDLFPSGELWAR